MTTKTKERGMLFSAPMVRAIIAGTKTQTRRMVKLAIPDDADEVFAWFGGELRNAPNGCADDGLYCRTRRGLSYLGKCPYGSPGSRLWVREGWRCFLGSDPRIEYRAGGTRNLDWNEDESLLLKCGKIPATVAGVRAAERELETGKIVAPWRSSVHMFREASRLTLEITSVRVERVQDITDADAIAEGVEHHTDEGVTYYGPLNAGTANPVSAYADLWESINGEGSWASNPLVWVIGFRRVE